MVLKRVGRKTVDVLVNGTEEATYTQDQDRRDYDVAVSDDTITFTTAISGSVYADDGSVVEIHETDIPQATWDIAAISRPERVRLYTNVSDGEHGAYMEWDDGTNFYSNSGTGTLDSGWIDLTAPIGHISIENMTGGNATLAWKVSFEFSESSGFSVDGVDQS